MNFGLQALGHAGHRRATVFFSFAGTSLAGYTTSGTLTANSSTSGFSPSDKSGVVSLNVSSNANIDSGITSWNGLIIEADMGVVTNGCVNIFFGVDSTGNHGFQMHLSHTAGSFGTNSGLAGAGGWTFSEPPSVGTSTNATTWYHVKVVINSAGTSAGVYIDGVLTDTVNITSIISSNSFVGFNASGGSAGGYIANISVHN